MQNELERCTAYVVFIPAARERASAKVVLENKVAKIVDCVLFF